MPSIPAIFTIRLPANCSVGVSGSTQRRRLPAARLDRRRGRDTERDAVHRRIGVLVRELERRRAVHEDGRQLRRGHAVVEAADRPEDRERPVGCRLATARDVGVRDRPCRRRSFTCQRATERARRGSPRRPRRRRRPAQSLAALSPSGDVSAAIDVNLIGLPGHGFDGSGRARRDELRALGAAAARGARQSATTAITHALARVSPRTPVHDCLPEVSLAPFADAVALVWRYASWMSSRRLDEIARHCLRARWFPAS